MGKLTCDCLNVKIHIKQGSNLQPVDTQTLEWDEDSSIGQKFFKGDIAEVPLDLEGITQEHSFLVKITECGDWYVSSCVNCDVITHAINNKNRSALILVNTALKGDSSIIDRVSQSSDFSPLYKVLLNKHTEEDSQPVRSFDLHRGEEKYESLQRSLTSIQRLLNTYLIQEESSMEERVRRFEEEEKARYSELKSRAKREKNIMTRLVLSNQDLEIQETLSDAMTDMTSPSSDGMSMTSPEQEVASPRHNGLQPANARFARQAPANRTLASYGSNTGSAVYMPPANNNNRSPTKPASDSDALFNLEGFEDDPFMDDASDDNDTDDTSSLTDSNGEDPRSGHPANTMPSELYSTSVPISVPRDWSSRKQRFSTTEFENDEERVPNPEDMAASIKALSRSVHVDTAAEMFGDRPTRRPNTRDLVRSYKQ